MHRIGEFENAADVCRERHVAPRWLLLRIDAALCGTVAIDRNVLSCAASMSSNLQGVAGVKTPVHGHFPVEL